MSPEHEALFRQLSDENIQALTVYGEARGEKMEGKFAVAFCLKNRHDLWKQPYHTICLKKNQFSCFLEKNKNFPVVKLAAQSILDTTIDDLSFHKCLLAVQGAQGGVCKGNIGNATFYRVKGTRNRWFDGAVARKTLIKVTEVGQHEFFEERRYHGRH